MDIIKTSIVFTKTIRNVARLREIVSIFAKNGFDEFISGKITSHIPNFVLPSSRVKIKDELKKNAEKEWPKIIGYRLRKCFEELGPSFIKLGQLLASREDLFEPQFIEEMNLLRDQALGIPYDVAKDIIENSLKKPVCEIFSSIDHDPIGKASIGVVFQGVLKDGSRVVVKVRRPGIAKIIEVDFSILSFLIGQIEKLSEEIKSFGISKIIDDFEVSLHNELNFNIEALNCKRFGKILKKYDDENLFYLPKIYEDFTNEDILIMERLDGIKFSDREEISCLRETVNEKLAQAIKIFSKTYLSDGFFHADLHGGNMFLMNQNKIGLIDFGSMGILSRKGRHNFTAIVYSLTSHNYENLVYEFLDVAEYDNIPDVEKLIHDVRQALRPFMGLTISEINSTQLLNVVIRTMTSHSLFVPREWLIVFRSLITLDGVSKFLDLDCDFFGELENNIKEIITSSFKKDEVIEEGIWAMRDILSSTRLIPRHLKWFLKDWARNNFSLEVRTVGYARELNALYSALMFLSFSILSSVFVFAGVLTMEKQQLGMIIGIPIITWFLWSISIFWILVGLLTIRISMKGA